MRRLALARRRAARSGERRLAAFFEARRWMKPPATWICRAKTQSPGR